MQIVKKSLVLAVLAAMGGSAWAAAPAKCGGADIANGPFAYTLTGLFSASFSGTGGAALDTGFDVAAPAPKTDNPTVDNVFPGQGALNECASYADAAIGVLEIELVADASGIPLATPTKIDPASALGQAILNAVSVTPTAWNAFVPGEKTSVQVHVANPNVGSANYGAYALKLAAKADGFGIGVGAGAVLGLTLAAPALTDKTPPTVSISKPGADEILGELPIEIKAMDPADSPAATGLASLSATVKSKGGKFAEQSVALTLDQSLTAAPGVMVTGDGEFIPTGGASGSATGTFTALAPSGIGTYTLKATGVDGAGNTTNTSADFKVGYEVSFNKAQSANTSSGACSQNGNTGGQAGCSTQLKFIAKRSSVTSDGLPMCDQSVQVKLLNSSSAVVATHVFSASGNPEDYVRLDTSIDPNTGAPKCEYQTTFKRGNIPSATSPSDYKAEVYFVDVDGNLVKQGSSPGVRF